MIDVGRHVLTVGAQVTGSVRFAVAGKDVGRNEYQGSATKS